MPLIPDRTRTVFIGDSVLRICEKIIPDNAVSYTYQAAFCRKFDPVKPRRPLGNKGVPCGVCVHYFDQMPAPENADLAERFALAVWPNCHLGGLALHYFVWHNSTWQTLSENEQGRHVGDGVFLDPGQTDRTHLVFDRDTIAIALIKSAAATIENGAVLTAHLLRKHGLLPESDLYFGAEVPRFLRAPFSRRVQTIYLQNKDL